MLSNNLPPESQPWVRALEAQQATIKGRANGIAGDIATQQTEIENGLKLLPARIASLQAAQLELANPKATTIIGYADFLTTIPANTWTTVQESLLTPPEPHKTNVSLGVISTGFVRTPTFNFTSEFQLIINGTPSPHRGVIPGDASGVAMGHFIGSGAVSIEIQFRSTNPSVILNQANYPNHWRTFVLAVWTP